MVQGHVIGQGLGHAFRHKLVHMQEYNAMVFLLGAWTEIPLDSQHFHDRSCGLDVSTIFFLRQFRICMCSLQSRQRYTAASSLPGATPVCSFASIPVPGTVEVLLKC